MSKIYIPKNKAREYSPLALNYYKGCSHGCLYCYVQPMMSRWNESYNHFEIKEPENIEEIKKSIANSCKKFANSKDQVLLNFTSDPYNELELKLGQEKGLTYFALTRLLENNIPVSILTKSHKVTRDIELFKKFGDKIRVGFSLTFLNVEDSDKWENGASTPINRLNALRELKSNGIKTWASFEPVILPLQSLALLYQVCKDNLTDFVKIGKLNNYKGLDKEIDWSQFLFKAVKICREYKMPFYIKNDLLKFKPEFLELTKDEINQDFFNI